jgi:hypothetical protein
LKRKKGGKNHLNIIRQEEES